MSEQPLQLSNDYFCFGCGSKNARGLQLSFQLDRDKKQISTVWTPTKELQGYANVVHGGMTGLVLDELMGNLLYLSGTPSVTSEMTVRFLRPGTVDQPLNCRAWIVEEKTQGSRRSFEMASEAVNGSGKIVAQASGRYVMIPPRGPA
jgi:acyl-coenzyme A thioesterase PaaI-like protein